MKLVAIVYHNAKKLTRSDYDPDYRFIKLFEDGSSQPIARENYDRAIRYVEARGCRAWGYWINNRPAVVWSLTRQDFEQAWGQPVLTAPCRFSRRNGCDTSQRIGDAGYLVPTRSRADIFQLRQRFPLFQGDLLMVPVEVLEAYQQKADRYDEVRQNQINEMIAKRRPAWERHRLLSSSFRVIE
jgi:hypothetical protein